MIGAARFERGEPPAEAGELIGRQLSNRLGDFFDLHVAQYSRSWARVCGELGKIAPCTTFGSPVTVAASFCLDPQLPNYRPPLVSVGLLQACKRLRRLLLARENLLAEIGEARAHARISQSLHDRRI